MTGIVRTGMRLLLLALIRMGVHGEDGLIFAEQSYEIKFPCEEEDVVCVHIWQLGTGQTTGYVALVINGDIQTAGSETGDSECTRQILEDFTAEDVGRHRCQRRPSVSLPHNTPSDVPELNLMPGKTVSLQCILLSFLESGQCDTPEQQQEVILFWVDEAGAEIREDAQHQITRRSFCEITLIVSLPSPGTKRFRCKASVDGHVEMSVELSVRRQAFRGRGRGFFVEPEPENQGGGQDTVSTAVGVVACAVLAVLIVAFVVNRRRTTRKQLADNKSSYRISTNNNVVDADEVTYADLILPAGPDIVGVHQWESTEYACVRY